MNPVGYVGWTLAQRHMTLGQRSTYVSLLAGERISSLILFWISSAFFSFLDAFHLFAYFALLQCKGSGASLVSRNALSQRRANVCGWKDSPSGPGPYRWPTYIVTDCDIYVVHEYTTAGDASTHCSRPVRSVLIVPGVCKCFINCNSTTGNMT